MMALSINRIRRLLQKPPSILWRRVCQEINHRIGKYWEPKQAHRFNLKSLLRKTASSSLAGLWQQLAARPYLADTAHRNLHLLKKNALDHADCLFNKAEQAMHQQINLLGTGLINLGTPIDWQKDYKTGIRWENRWCHAIDYMNLDKPSDVKIPWEISRLQWLIPIGQAFLLNPDDHYAQTVKTILTDWITQNSYAYSVNWSCTMEVALRIITMTWLFHVFHNAPSWQDPVFQEKFLINLFLHAKFTRKNLEESDINGNHYLADAAGLVFAGLFFGPAATPTSWLQRGWNILTTEIGRQVTTEGVDYEASIAYHRLVCELLFFPALYRKKLGMTVPIDYCARIIKMAEYINAYTRIDGSVPLLGDADDARVLPLGDQGINDHRYLPALIGQAWDIAELQQTPHFQAEIYWLFGEKILNQIDRPLTINPEKRSIGLINSGYYIMRNDRDHIFIDCAPIGLAGRGGHGHNDCLSFEAVIDGELIITDCGAYLYTASVQERNHFRSTAAHNTPQIDHQEINRFESPHNLWSLCDDAKPRMLQWRPGAESDYFCGFHSGYQRLSDPVGVKREFYLFHQQHTLVIKDEFTGQMAHTVRIPFHLAPGVHLQQLENYFELRKNGKIFHLYCDNPDEWTLYVIPNRISPSYGIIEKSQTIYWERTGQLIPFQLTIAAQTR